MWGKVLVGYQARRRAVQGLASAPHKRVESQWCHTDHRQYCTTADGSAEGQVENISL